MRNKRNSTIATTIGLIVVLGAIYLMVRDIGLAEGRPAHDAVAAW